MPAPADSPMNKDVYDRLSMIAGEHDNNDEHGEAVPRLRIILASGFELPECQLMDGSNSLDDKSIDLVTDAADLTQHWIVVIDQIAAIHQRYPEKVK